MLVPYMCVSLFTFVYLFQACIQPMWIHLIYLFLSSSSSSSRITTTFMSSLTQPFNTSFPLPPSRTPRLLGARDLSLSRSQLPSWIPNPSASSHLSSSFVLSGRVALNADLGIFISPASLCNLLFLLFHSSLPFRSASVFAIAFNIFLCTHFVVFSSSCASLPVSAASSPERFHLLGPAQSEPPPPDIFCALV